MPYIDPAARSELDPDVGGYRWREPEGAGELNYVITKLVVAYIERRGDVRYERIAEVTGVLENVKQEFYRRVAAPYEDKKIVENGDTYPA